MKSAKTQPKESVWRSLDILAGFAVLLFGMPFALMFVYYWLIWICAVPALLFTAFGKRLYAKDQPRSAAFRWITGSIRAVIYTVSLGSMLLFYLFLSCRDRKWMYPVTRAVYLDKSYSDSILHTLLPERLPEQADDYSAHFVPKMLQGSAHVYMFYYTDSGTISEYKQAAESAGAEHLLLEPDEAQSDAGKWFAVMEEFGASAADLEDAECYVFSDRGVWMLNEQTGYFRIYW